MATALKTYDTKIDSKKRITLRGAKYDYFHVEEFEDGRILLEPRVLAVPLHISENTFSMMDSAVSNLKKGKVSEAIDLSDFED